MSQGKRKIRIGSRESKLAVIQAQLVIDAIKRFDSECEIELVTMKTTGDIILDRTLDQIGGKGLFVKELDKALFDGCIDISVHSFKDMPMEIDPQLPVVALSHREDPRDVLILPKGERDLSRPVGCSSKRRSLQLKERPGFENIAPVRGNVLTRLQKLDNGEFSALVLAAAGIKRLGLENRISRYFSTQEIIPAACQGIIAVQARKGENTEYLSLFHSDDSFYRSQAERAFVKQLDGGCSSPVAAFAELQGDKLILTGLYYDELNKEVYKDSIVGNKQEAENLGRQLADKFK